MRGCSGAYGRAVPLVIACEALKGGVGKTTTAVALAEAAAARGDTVVLCDTDPQGSASRWADLAAEAGRPLSAVVVGLATPDLARRLPAVSAVADVVVIDGPPGEVRITDAGAAAADVIVVPCPPRLADVERASVTLDRFASLGTPCVVSLTMGRASTRARVAAADAFAALGAMVSAAELPLREAVARDYGQRPSATLATFGVELLGELAAVVRPRRSRRGSRRG